MSRRQPPITALRVLAKLAFGLAVFATTVGGWVYFQPSVVNHMALPDSIAESEANGCALWFIGSSSIAKWPELDRDFPGWQAHKRGIDGARIEQIEARALRTESKVAPAGIIFYAGENDIALGASGAGAAQAMIDLAGKMAAKWPGVPIFIISTKPSPERWLQRGEQLRYNDVVGRLATDRPNLVLVHAGTSLLRDGKPDPALYTDRVHLNADGYALWSRDIRGGVEPAMARQRTAGCSAAASKAQS